MDKKIIGITIVLAIIFVFGALLFVRSADSSVSGNTVGGVSNLYQVDLEIEGMYCDACAYGVKAQIEALEGVVSAEINVDEASGIVKYDADKVGAEEIAKASTVYLATVVEDFKLNQ